MSKRSNTFPLGLNLTPDAKNQSNDDTDIFSREVQQKMRFQQDTKQRKTLVIWMMVVVSFWLVLALFIVVCNNLLCFNVSDSVLTVLLATTTANVLGLPIIILKDLFGRGNNKKKK